MNVICMLMSRNAVAYSSHARASPPASTGSAARTKATAITTASAARAACNAWGADSTRAPRPGPRRLGVVIGYDHLPADTLEGDRQRTPHGPRPDDSDLHAYTSQMVGVSALIHAGRQIQPSLPWPIVIHPGGGATDFPFSPPATQVAAAFRNAACCHAFRSSFTEPPIPFY